MGLSGEGRVVSGAMTKLLQTAVRSESMGKQPKEVFWIVWSNRGLRALKRIRKKLK
jgi:hypothetical protein